MKSLSKIIATLWVLTAMLLTACEEQNVSGQSMSVDSLLLSAYHAHDYDSILRLADTHQEDGTLSDMKACYWRGYAYSRLRKMRMAEVEWKNAVAQQIKDEEDLDYYAQSANRLAGLLYLKTDCGEVIRVALPAINYLKEKGYTTTDDYSNLLAFVGSCQLKLGRDKEASASYSQAWQHYQHVTRTHANLSSYTSAIVGIVTIVDAYLQTAHYEEAYEWAERLDSMLQQCKDLPQASEDYIDKQLARLYLYRACALEGLGHKEEARQAYNKALTTHYTKSSEGKIEATGYLMAAHRWNEAADMFQELETQAAKYDFIMTQEYIQTYLLPKYFANVKAHRKDSAIVVGTEICMALDTALVWQKQTDAAELAAIYETQQKETELAEQRARLSDQRLLTMVITLFLVILGFCLFIFFRHRSAMRLEAAFYDLERANSRAEESSRMKSDFIQQISHEIRTPLNILSGFTQLITTPGTSLDEATMQEVNQKIVENTNRITSLVNKMLELSEAKSHAVIERSDRVTAVQIAAEAINASGITEASHLTFDLQVSPDAEQVVLQTNQQAAVRALSLVLDNARKFTALPEAKQQEKPTDVKQKVTLRISVQSDHLFFSVEDTGIGIPHKEAERIFEEFVQLDEFYDGTGIGLTVARSMIRRIGGNIKVDTAYIGGSRFVITLPL
jgi:signal transduction histidine kinase